MKPWIPNAITGLRLVLIVPLSMALRDGNWQTALILAVIASVSDGVDGWLARRFHWQTWIGGMLDPLADKLLVLACYGGLALREVLPLWLVATVVARDLIIVIGATLYHNKIAKLKADPSPLGKFTTALQLAFIALILLHLNQWVPLSDQAETVLEMIVAAFTIVSGLDYVRVWSAKAKQEHPKMPEP